MHVSFQENVPRSRKTKDNAKKHAIVKHFVWLAVLHDIALRIPLWFLTFVNTTIIGNFTIKDHKCWINIVNFGILYVPFNELLKSKQIK